MDNAIFQLITVHSSLEEKVESADGARAVASIMMPVIDELIFCHNNLLQKKAKKGGKPQRA